MGDADFLIVMLCLLSKKHTNQLPEPACLEKTICRSEVFVYLPGFVNLLTANGVCVVAVKPCCRRSFTVSIYCNGRPNAVKTIVKCLWMIPVYLFLYKNAVLFCGEMKC